VCSLCTGRIRVIMMNQTPSSLPVFSRPIVRLAGVLVTVAVLLLAFPASAAPTLDGGPAALVAPSAPEVILLPTEPVALQEEETPLSMAAPIAEGVSPEVSSGLGLQTGDRLDEAGLAEYHAYIADMKERGLHRGFASFASW
jgi:hypothetical protein